MIVVNKLEPILLLVGDIIIFYGALWLTLLVRYWELPTMEIWSQHSIPFSILFAVWIAFFYIAGLYEKHTVLFRNKLPSIILNTQIVNSIAAVTFFYLIPSFSIAPKTNLFIYLVICFSLVLLWRLVIFSNSFFNEHKYNAILVGSGDELHELKKEVNSNPRYGFKFIRTVDLQTLPEIDFKEEVLDIVYTDKVTMFAIDIRNEAVQPILPKLYNLIFSHVHFVDKHKVYENIFDRIPLSIISHNWFLENISSRRHIIYDFFKRVMDVFVSLILGILSLIFYPFVILAIWIEDQGNPFIVQNRVGKGNKQINLIKFRTMKHNDNGGKWPTEKDNENKVTKVGAFLRKSRIDELPQLWNVLKGDISLIGPRPDIVGNFEILVEKVPYYSIRNIVKPGLSGWAQIHQEVPPHSVEETKTRLAYDLYYIKNRSLLLDIKIALRTVKTLIARTGR